MRDRAAGVFSRHTTNSVMLGHKGEHFQMRGPLNIARPPQGYPVIVQAGASEPGRELAARTAEVIFTANLLLEDAQEFYGDVKARLGKYGRAARGSPGDAGHLRGARRYRGRGAGEI